MDNNNNKKAEIVATEIGSFEEGAELLERLFQVADPGGVYSEPITAEGHTVITASEVTVGMGFGYGGGTGPNGEGGTGGGGGGGAAGRPVAAIIISADGVRVEPIVDPTKIALAMFTAVGSFLLMLGRMSKASRG